MAHQFRPSQLRIFKFSPFNFSSNVSRSFFIQAGRQLAGSLRHGELLELDFSPPYKNKASSPRAP
jgi:hypothetical protein